MGIVKFKTGYSESQITRVEVLRETEQCVYLEPFRSGARAGKTERREAKRSDYAQYHDTWADAHAFLLKRAECVVENARIQLAAAQGRLDSVKGMKQPKGAQ